MKLTYFGHACFMLESGGYKHVMDPYAPGSVPGLKDLYVEANGASCSHGHDDHCCIDAIKMIEKSNVFNIETISCFHDDVEGGKRGKNTIYIFEAEGKRVAHFGDLGHNLSEEQIKTLGHIDVALVPVGGHYTISAKEAHDILSKCDVHTIVPMHYRTKTSGYDVLTTVDDFTKLYDDVLYAGSSILITDDLAKVVVMEQEKIK